MAERIDVEYGPCPFCGDHRAQLKPVWGNYWFVACACKAAGPPRKNMVEAVECWNARAEAPAPARQRCLMTWHPEVYGFVCSSCNRVTFSAPGERMAFCPKCGAEAVPAGEL